MTSIERLINTAAAELGYLEKKSNKDLDDKTANAGTNNYTKYGRDMGCNGYAWCDAFVDWCFMQTFGRQLASKMIGGYSNYTPTSASYYKKMNRFFTTPEVGDQIFFKNSYRINHTGIIYKVENGFIYTIEGNTSDGTNIVANGGAVCSKQYKLTNNRIAGYGRPRYELAEMEATDAMAYGIDISDNQGVINWEKVKADGVEFAILRTVRKDGSADRYLLQNIKGCVINNIKLGFYKYSYALDEKQAQDEAKAVINVLSSCGVKPSRDIFIWFDCEDDKQIELGKAKLNSVYDCFKEVIWNAGYSYGLYMGKYDYENKSDFYDLNDYVWIARYPDTTTRTVKNPPADKYKPTAKGNNILWGWQFSSKGRVNGIDGNVDLNCCYADVMASAEPKEPKPIEYYKKPSFSLIECLNNIGVDSSKANRKKIAEKNRIENYTGTVEQNLKMLDLLLNGQLIK